MRSGPPNLPAALAFVPNWWPDTSEPAALDGLLAGWVRAAGWRAGGFVWPADAPGVARIASGGQVTELVPPEVPDASRRIKGGE